MSVGIEAQLHLNKFSPRSYQLPIIQALEDKGYRRVVAIMPRRAGKDVMAFNICIRQCIRRTCVVYYIFPTYSQGRKALFDSILNDGQRFLDFIPKELIEAVNQQEMKIRFKNGSLLQIVGSDNVDSLMGTNPQGVVFSEYALQDPRAYQFIRPILAANDGWALFISTPRGKNHLYDLYQIAQHSSQWYYSKLTLDDTKHIPLREIDKERAEGIMSEDLIQQEYYTSFEMGVEGAYYAKYLDKMRIEGRIGDVPWQSEHVVHAAFDLGVRDSTAIIWFQIVGTRINIIDCYENAKEGLEHYVNVLKEKPYTYGRYIAPHDIQVKEWGSGMTRYDKAKQLGIEFTVCPNHLIVDGIEKVRSTMSIMRIDAVKCAPLLKALENYRQEYDVKNRIYKANPLHNWASHFADCMRYLCLAQSRVQRVDRSREEVDRDYREAVYGENSGLPGVFRDEFSGSRSGFR